MAAAIAFGLHWPSPSYTISSRIYVSEHQDLPHEFGLNQNYPNPFNPSTTIRYGLPNRSHVTLTVFNTLGQQVAQLVNGDMNAGYHEIQFDGRRLSSGVYFYRLQAGDYVATKRLLVLRWRAHNLRRKQKGLGNHYRTPFFRPTFTIGMNRLMLTSPNDDATAPPSAEIWSFEVYTQ